MSDRKSECHLCIKIEKAMNAYFDHIMPKLVILAEILSNKSLNPLVLCYLTNWHNQIIQGSCQSTDSIFPDFTS